MLTQQLATPGTRGTNQVLLVKTLSSSSSASSPLTLDTTHVVEGRSVTLSCSSDANPAASYTWYKEDEEEPAASGPIFIINDFRDERSGRYRCDAQNNRGRSNSTCQLTVAGESSITLLASD
ncbi:B-cell receptor CD22 [Liparis tanakae]|uniref:B-cell receptor CD22 n=1 Tax=Liparis tanakae TaxID=230148 RepID=A0A4Z2HZJ0_9TELE|nr:B-cell receptor CD22 [Liparis tanakae]